MNREKFENKINNKYGVTSFQLAGKTIKEAKKLKLAKTIEKKAEKKGISNLEVSDNIKKTLVGKYIAKNFVGANIGIAIAEGVNYWVPGFIPNIVSFFTGVNSAKLPLWKQALIVIGTATKPAYEVSHITVIGAGAILGMVAYNGYTLVKKGINHHIVKKDIEKSKKLHC